jgi:signal peptidase I
MTVMSHFSVRRVVAFLIFAAVAVVGWLLLGPAQLGGPARYAIIDGTSMVPTLVDGDLAIVRAEGEPRKGEIVLYHDPRLGVDVLHRIVRETRGGRFVMKGDNNDYLDDARPTADELGGTLWFTVPYLGAGVEWLRQPLHAAIAVFVLVALGFAGGGGATHRRRARTRHTVGFVAPGTQVDGALRGLLTAALVAALLFGLLALAAFSRSVTRAETVEEARIHEGTLSYSAAVETSDVYPDGVVRSGETAFLQLVPALDVAFAYRFTADGPEDLSGEAGITAVVSDGAGWLRRVPVAPARVFEGSSTTVRGTVDLAELAEIVQEMKSLTGSLTTTFSVRIEPTVEVSGRVGSDDVDESFTTQIPFLLDDVSLRVDAPADGSPALSARKAEPGTIQVPARLAVGDLGIAVEQAQRLAVLGLVLSLVLLAFAAVAFGTRRTTEGEHGRIASRFGDRMITIARPPAIDSDRVTDVADLEGLARVAELHDRIVLHWRRGDGHVYLVDDGSTVYRFRSGAGAHEPIPADLEDTLVLPG